MKVGSLVECVGSFTQVPGEIVPVNGKIYTVRAIACFGHEAGILLEEIVNEPQEYAEGFYQVHFAIDKFREIQPPMDISELIEECHFHEFIQKLIAMVHEHPTNNH